MSARYFKPCIYDGRMWEGGGNRAQKKVQCNAPFAWVKSLKESEVSSLQREKVGKQVLLSRTDLAFFSSNENTVCSSIPKSLLNGKNHVQCVTNYCET